MKRTVVLSALLALMLLGCVSYDPEAGYYGAAVYPSVSFGWYDDSPSYAHYGNYPGYYGGYRSYYGGHHGSGHGSYHHGGHHGGHH